MGSARLPGVVKSALNGQGVAGVTLLFTTGPNVGKTVRGAVRHSACEHQAEPKALMREYQPRISQSHRSELLLSTLQATSRADGAYSFTNLLGSPDGTLQASAIAVTAHAVTPAPRPLPSSVRLGA